MKRIFIIPGISVAILSFLLITGCGSATDNSRTGNQADTTTAETPVVIPEDAVFLGGLYATSVNSPYQEFSPELVFDGTGKYWATMPGAGPDEGIMMYFNGLENVGSMEVKFAGGEKLGKILSMDLYVNGALQGEITPESAIYKGFEGTLNSVYLRIKKAEGVKSRKKAVNEDEITYSLQEYAASVPVGIEEITFKDKSGKKMNVMPLKSLTGQVTASSTLSPAEAYTPDFLFDSRYDFGWAEGNKEGSGKDEKLTFVFDNDQNISKIRIWNGFQRSDAHFKSNARVKQLEFGLTGQPVSYTLADQSGMQEIVLQKPLKGKEFTLKITDIYPGASYKDLVISEMMFYTDYGWSVLSTGGVEKRKQELLQKTNGTVMSAIMDHWFFEEKVSIEYFKRTTSFIIRSNQSFVIWQDERTTDRDTEGINTVYDGNWEFVSATKDVAKIKIFGKRRMLTQGYGAYKGKGTTDRVTIFSDVLTITPNELRGEKFIDEIKLK